jgi:hypothetical protein
VSFMPTEAASGAKTKAMLDAGQNPPSGVVVHYWLSEKPNDGVTLTFLDEAGTEIRSYATRKEKQPAEAEEPASTGETQQESAVEEVATALAEPEPEEGPWAPAEAGMNRFVWDGSYPKPPKLIKRKPMRARDEELEASVAPKAMPGAYRVRLTVGDTSQTHAFRILVDPRLTVSEQDLKAQFDLRLAIRDRVAEVHDALNQIQRVRDQVEHWEERLKDHASAQGVKDSGKALKDRLTEVERELMNLDADKPRPGGTRIKEKLQALSAMVAESEHAPTRGASEVYELLRAQVEEQRRKLSQVLAEPLAEFNSAVSAVGVQPVAV